MLGRTGSIGRRFLLLTVAGYVVAVLASVLALRIASEGTLQSMQDAAIRDHAAANAQSVQNALEDTALQLGYITRDADIVNLAIGDTTDDAAARDALAALDVAQGVVSLALFDFLGDVVLEDLREEGANSFDAAEKAALAQGLVSADGASPRYRFRPGHTRSMGRFLVGLPLVRNGIVDGALIVEMAIDLSLVFPDRTSIGAAQLMTPFQMSMADAWGLGDGDFITVPVGETGIDMILIPDRASVALIGRELVARVTLAVGLVLLLPFGLMCAAGYRAIIGPHEALAVSREALRQRSRQLRELADISERLNDVIVATDLDGRLTWANHALTEKTGYRLDEVMGRSPGSFLQGPDTDPEVRAEIGRALAMRQPIRREVLNYTKSGTPYWNLLSISPQVDGRGRPYRFVAIATDITLAKRAQEEILRAKSEIEHQAMHDPLTGLPNRRALDDALASIASPSGGDRVLIRIDLDHFKNVNDTLGHAAGDFVLDEVARILLHAIGEGDMAARVGGDEFVILLAEGRTRADGEELSKRLLSEIQKDMEFEDRYCRIGASFGIAAAADGLVGNEDLLSGADAALYTAKTQGRNAVITYSDALHDGVVEARVLASELQRGLLRGEFEPFFQPQFDAATGAFTGLEALVRWRHPTRGVLTPDVFLTVAEQLSVVEDIDEQVSRLGLAAVSRLNASGMFVPKVSFNVVARRLQDPDLPQRICADRPEGTRISFEVLESVLVEEQSTEFQFQIDRLKDLGFGVEVDDFGSGHASIIGLMQLGPDAMKIDHRLIVPLTTSDVAMRMVQAILEIGKALGIRVTAEGVETAEHARILADMGCDTLQGFYFARPMPCDELGAFLRRYRPAPRVLTAAEQGRTARQ
ncbi:MAG: EAL domain-containing protein [Pseudomonadota bacterium]